MLSGDFAFPQKAYEIIATRSPCIAPQFGAMAEMLESTPKCFYTPGDPNSIATGIMNQIENPQLPELDISTWAGQAEKIRLFTES